MSFLPYEQAPAATWFTAVGGSSVLHAGLAASLLMSSVAFLPPPSTAPLRASDFEVSLEILDLESVETISEIPPDATPLSPGDGPLIAPEVEETLAPDTPTLTPPDENVLAPDSSPVAEPDLIETALLDPDTTAEAPLLPEPETIDVPVVAVPEAVVETLPQEPDLAPLEPEPIPEEAPLAEAVQPAPPTQDPDEMAIDDISPIDNTVINPLAEVVGVAPAEPLQPAAPVQPTGAMNTTSSAIVATSPDAITLNVTEVVEPEITTFQPAAPLELAALPEDTITEPTPQDVTEITPEVGAQTDPEPEASAPLESDPEPEPATTAALTTSNAIANPSAEAQAIGTLLQRIRSAPAPTCTLALPRQAGPNGVALSLISATPGAQAVTAYLTSITQGMAITPTVSTEPVDARQCALLDTLRGTGAYPASRLGISLEDTTLTSGGALRGRVTGAGGQNLVLLLVDDNGVVQDMARFATAEENGVSFDAPVARSGPARATRQIFLAIGDPTGRVDLNALIGDDAQAAFATLSATDVEGLVFGLTTFDVR